ncbi:hypothetical protein HMPREF9984_00396 [Staphylococcus epidermidis NIHLM037]|nr:hypothetical protein HMPREF9984_00396 [Staphylococcus epidermidis NIHLM037]
MFLLKKVKNNKGRHATRKIILEIILDVTYNVFKITREGLALGPRMGVGES